MTVKVQRLHPDAILPSYHYPGDAGLAMHCLDGKVLAPGERHRFDVGWALEFDAGMIRCTRCGFTEQIPVMQ